MRRQERKNGDLSSSALLTRKLFVVVCRLVDDERARRPSIEIFDGRGPSLLFWIILKDEVCPGNQLLSSPINAAHIVKRIKSKTLESLPTILFLSWVSYLILIRRFLPNLIFFLIFPFFVYIAGNLGNWANRSMTHSRRAIYFSFELFMNRNHFFVHYCSWIFFVFNLQLFPIDRIRKIESVVFFFSRKGNDWGSEWVCEVLCFRYASVV